MERIDISKVRIKTYSEVELDSVKSLFKDFKLPYENARGGHPVVHTRTLRDATSLAIPSSTRYPKDSEAHNQGENFITSPTYHKESSFNSEQLPYVDLLNRLLVDLIRKNFKKEVILFFDSFEDKIQNGEYKKSTVLRSALERSVVEMLRRLCEDYPNLLLVTKAFFLQRDGVGIDGLQTAITFGINKENVIGPNVEEGLQNVFIGVHPNDLVKEYELMCAGMAVAFEIAEAIQDSFKELNLTKEEVAEVSYTLGLNDNFNFYGSIEDNILKAVGRSEGH